MLQRRKFTQIGARLPAGAMYCIGSDDRTRDRRYSAAAGSLTQLQLHLHIQSTNGVFGVNSAQHEEVRSLKKGRFE